MKKSIFNILTALVLCLAMAVTAFARTGSIVPDQVGDGTITFTLKNSDDDPIDNGAISLFKVANMGSDGTKFLYEVTSDFADFSEEIDGETFTKYLKNLENDFDLEHNAYFADALQTYKDENDLTAYQTVYVDEDGQAVFTNLTNGLYLGVQTVDSIGYHKMSPFLISVPKCVVDEDGNALYYYEIDAQPKTQPLERVPDDKPHIPQDETPNTGLPWMPVIIMAVSGLVLFSAGYIRHKKAEVNE